MLKTTGILGVLLACAAPVNAEIYSVALAACPPWKTGANQEQTDMMLQMCEHDAKNITSALQSSLGVKEENTIVLVQENAIPERFNDAIAKLSEKVGPEDTVFFYVAMHGGNIKHTYKGYPVDGEVFAFYTKDEPSNYSEAVDTGTWMSARELRDKISTFTKEHDTNSIVLIEACHAGATFHEFKHNPELHLEDEGKLATVFAAQEDQIAHFTDDFTGGRFTTDFSDALRDAEAGDSIFKVLMNSTVDVVTQTHATCNASDPEVIKRLFSNTGEYYETCVQEPSWFDPHGILGEVGLKAQN